MQIGSISHRATVVAFVLALLAAGCAGDEPGEMPEPEALLAEPPTWSAPPASGPTAETCLASAQAGEPATMSCLSFGSWGFELGDEIEPECRQ